MPCGIYNCISQYMKSISIDMDRDNVFPELNPEDLKKVGASENKKVLLKKSIIDRNGLRHPDITKGRMEHIISQALYNPSEVFLAHDKKPYYHFAKIIGYTKKGKLKTGYVLLDVKRDGKYFEIVHIHYKT